MPKRNSLKPLPSLHFLKRMTTSMGIIQHSKLGVPDWNHGYCLDDNGRALALMARYLQADPDNIEVRELSARYLAYIYFCQREDGWMRNFMTHDLKFIEEIGSWDSFGRAIWGLGECAVSDFDPGVAKLCEQILLAKSAKIAEFKPSARGQSYALLGLVPYLKHSPHNNQIKQLIQNELNRLKQKFHDTADEHWQWYEAWLTYSNALLCHSTLIAAEVLGDDEGVEIGLKALRWLLDQTEVEADMRKVAAPIGHEGWYKRGGIKADWGQQPIDVTMTILACQSAYAITNDKFWKDAMKRWYGWFYGENMTGTIMVNEQEGWCYDGLYMNRVNPNHGAETIIMYLMAQLAMRDLK